MDLGPNNIQSFSGNIKVFHSKLKLVINTLQELKTLKDKTNVEVVSKFKDLDNMLKNGQIDEEEYKRLIKEKINPEKSRDPRRPGTPGDPGDPGDPQNPGTSRPSSPGKGTSRTTGRGSRCR